MSSGNAPTGKPPIIRTRIFYPDVMAEQGRKGGLRAAEVRDNAAVMAHAREAQRRKFEQLADPDGTLEPAERERRIAELRRRHYAELGRRGAASRHGSRESSKEAA